MASFRSAKSLQKFTSIHSSVHNHFSQMRHLCSREYFKVNRSNCPGRVASTCRLRSADHEVLQPNSFSSDIALFRHQIVVTLASLYPLSSWSGGRRSVDTLVSEQCPGDACCLIGHGDQHDVCRPPRQEPVGSSQAPCPAWRGASAARFRAPCTSRAPDIAIPALRDPPQPVLAATRVLSGHETEPRPRALSS